MAISASGGSFLTGFACRAWTVLPGEDAPSLKDAK
jgi:hypothetical protein